MDLLFLGLFILIILFLSALVSGSEAALLSVSYPKAKELAAKRSKKQKAAKRLLIIKDNLQKYITTIVILNNIINIVGSIYVGVLATRALGEIYLGIMSAILTFLIILFAEIIPKVYGEKYSDIISIRMAPILIIITKIFTPIVFILNFLTSIFVKESSKSKVSEGEIREMAVLGMQEGSIDSYESGVIRNVFKMNDVEAYDIMVPKHKVITLNKHATFTEIVKTAQKTGFTRFPIEQNSEVIGIINVKDMFKFHGKEDEFSIKKILRPIVFVPEAMKISTLEEKLKRNRIHMAAIVNEHGDFTGIATLEDVIEELLGEIEDEFDSTEEMIKEIKENKYHINAAIELQELNQKLNLNLDINDDYSTLNGFLVQKLDRIPNINDEFAISEGKFRVIQRSKKKVLKVEFRRKS